MNQKKKKTWRKNTKKKKIKIKITPTTTSGVFILFVSQRNLVHQLYYSCCLFGWLS